MKKLALLLGSLLVVSAAASAKEVVPAPVVVEEAPVKIVEKEVIVYKEKEQGFRPSGNVDLEYRYYGNTENKGYDTDTWGKDEEVVNNPNNNYSRTQLQGKINMTEKQALDFRVRAYNSLDHVNRDTELNNAGSKGNRTETRLRYYYKHTDALTSRVDYQNKAEEQSLAYNLFYDWANDFGTSVTVGPRYKYTWNKSNDSNYSNSIGLYFDAQQQLPYGFTAELEIDGFDYVAYGTTQSNAYETSYKPDALKLSVGAYLKQTTPLFSNDVVAVTLNSEGGYDTYNWSNRELVTHNGDDRFDSEYCSYSAYLSSNIRADYKATEFVKLYAGVGAEYRNWTAEAQENAKVWRWQPYAFAGVKTTF